MITEQWVGPSPQAPSGDWNVAANWSGGVVPGQSDAVILQPLAAAYTITIQNGEQEAVEEIDYRSPLDPDQASTITVAIAGGLLESDFVDTGLPAEPLLSLPIVLTDGGTFYTSVSAAGASNGLFRFGDGTGDLLDLGSVGQHQDFASPAGPDNFAGPIEGFGGSNRIHFDLIRDEPDDVLSYVQNDNVGTLSITEVQTDRFNNTQVVSLAQLNFVGAYTAGNFRLVPGDAFSDTSDLLFQLNPITSAGDRQIVQGTPGDDLITAAGSLDTIMGNGGNDTIVTSGSYETIIVGFDMDEQAFLTPDPSGLTDTITLGGRGNTLRIGDENTVITASAGFDNISLGAGNATLTLGPYSTVTTAGGTSSITALTGHNVLRLFDDAAVAEAGHYTVTLGGIDNTVDATVDGLHGLNTLNLTGGDGQSSFDIQGNQDSVVTGGFYNKFIVSPDGTANVTTGAGYATVHVDTGDFGNTITLVLDGTHNLVDGYFSVLNISGGTGSNTFNLDTDFDSVSLTIATGGLYNKFNLSADAQNTITAGSGYDTVTIAPSSSPGNDDNPPLCQVNLAGLGNLVSITGTDAIVTGGTGYGTFRLDQGDDTVTTAGKNNAITLGAGQDTVTADGDDTIVTLNGTDAAAMLHGAGDKMFLNAGAGGTIGGGPAPDLHIYVAPGIGTEAIAGLAADPRAIVDLRGGAGGYTGVAQVMAALTPDGHGGTALAIGSGSLDFVGVAPSGLHAGLFVIG